MIIKSTSAARVFIYITIASIAGALQGNARIPDWKPEPSIEKAIANISPAELEKTIAALVSAGTRHSASESPDDKPASRGIGVARRWLARRFHDISKNSGGRLEVIEEPCDLVSEHRLPNGRAKGANVIARLPGTADRNRVIIISGHYDSINKKFDRRRGGIDAEGDAPGADDDGSGTAVAVECARVLAKLQFPATIEFACFTAEEQGLLGSEIHAANLKKAGADAMILNNDIVGSSRAADGVVRDRQVRVFSTSAKSEDSLSRNLARHARDVANLYFKDSFSVNLILRTDRYKRGGDHTSFEKVGFAGIRFSEPREDYLHQHENVRDENGGKYGDRIEFVDFEYLARVARLNAALAAELASAPPPPADVALDGALRNDTKITVKPNAAANLAGYEAVARNTEDNSWHAAYPLEGNRGVIPVLLDDSFIGVRAVSNSGRRSIALVPPEPPSSIPGSAPASK